MERRQAWIRLFCILPVLAALLWWIVFTLQAEDSVFTRIPLLDEKHYLQEAASPDSGEAAPYFMSPIYPSWLSLLGAGMAPGESCLEPGGRGLYPWFQGALWLGTALLIWGSGRRLLSHLPMTWRLLPAGLFLLYGPMAVYGQMALVEMPLVFLISAILFWSVEEDGIPGRGLLLGLALGLAVLLRGSMMVLAIPLVFWIWRGRSGSPGAIVLFLASLLLVLGPAVVHNSRLAGRLCGPTLNGGLNLYLGNGPEATGLGTGFSTDWQEDPAGLQELSRRTGKVVSDLAEADALWMALTWDAVRESPARTLGLWLRKWHRQWQGWEMNQITSLKGWKDEVPALRVLILPWGALTALAFVGIVSKGWRRRRLLILLGLMLGTQALFFVVSRYRMALLPLICPAAAAGLWALLQGRGTQRWLSLAGLVVGMLLVWPWGSDQERHRRQPLVDANHAQRWALLANRSQDSAHWEEARRLYAQAVSRVPDQGAPYLGYAAVLKAREQREEAMRILDLGIQSVPDPLPLRRARLSLLLEEGRRDDAEKEARILLAEHPADLETMHNLVVLRAQAGDIHGALTLAGRMVRSQPHEAQGYLDLGVMLARSGDREGAEKAFRRGLAAIPDHRDLQENLNRLMGKHP